MLVTPAADWLARCVVHARDCGLGSAQIEVLYAFGGPPSAEAASARFGALAARAADAVRPLAEQIGDVLGTEVDRGQAALFGRRFEQVAALLQRQAESQEAASLLAVGLVMRTAEVLGGPPPRALRIRAIVDFYYSHAAVLHHGATDASLTDIAAHRTVWRPVAAGVEHGLIDTPGPFGPLHVNVLRMAAGAGRLEAVDSRLQPDLVTLVRARGAVAGVSGGFFLYSEPDIAPPSLRLDPVGLLVHEGTVVSPPVLHRAALVQDADGGWRVTRIGPVGARLEWPGATVRIAAHNRWPGPEGAAVAFNRAFGEVSPDHPGVSVALVGDRVVAAGPGAMPIPLAGLVVALAPGGPAPRVGGSVVWRIPDAVVEAMAGGPMLLRPDPSGRAVTAISRASEDFVGSAPPITFSRDETFDQNLLPRMAAGVTADGAVIFCAVDGRNFDRAPGLTLRGVADLVRGLGCVHAMNLDGGSSKRLVVGERVMDLPSTEVQSNGQGADLVRPVHSALLLFAAGGGARLRTGSR